MPMANDPYAGEARYSLGAVAGNHFVVVPSDAADLARGVKALDVENRTDARIVIKISAVNQVDQTLAAAVGYGVPGFGIRSIPVRAQRVWLDGLASAASVAVIGYTD